VGLVFAKLVIEPALSNAASIKSIENFLIILSLLKAARIRGSLPVASEPQIYFAAQ